MSIIEKFSADLNPAQREAVNTLLGPLLILAGAGSGKTRVLTYRMANLVATGEAAPHQLLAVTFTNKAAREMEARIVQLLRSMNIPVYEPMWVSTFHSICARILREHIHYLGFQPFFAIYDDADQLAMIKKVLSALNINDKIYPPKMFQARIDEAKRLGLGPGDLHKRPRFFMDDKVLPVFERYEEDMQRANALDFGDLLLKTYELFRSYPEVLEIYRDRFPFILVDEYQDTNHIQYLLVKLLAEKHRNLCVVGDEDQSIYSWRGADITNILTFEKDFPEAKVIKLEENYRSTQTIVNAASAVIRNNTQRKDKTLFSNAPMGEKIVVHEDLNEYEEARFVAQEIERRIRAGSLTPKDFAVFYRTNAQSRVIEDLMRSHNLPYRIIGGVRFYERMEIKDILAYMKLILNPSDDIAAKRIINVPARGIGKTTIEKIEGIASQEKIPFLQAIQLVIDRREVHSGAARKLREFTRLIENLIEASVSKKVSEVFLKVTELSEYVVRLKEEGSPEAESRIDNLEELQNAIVQFEQERGDEANLQSFLEEIALVSEIDKMNDSDDFVTLMTLHISKGLEFPVVFMVGVEEGLFPSGRSLEDSSEEAVEEERRLAYVGMTRAREKLFITHARTRRVWGQEQQHPPSRFIKEIPEEYVQFDSRIQKPRLAQRFASSQGTGGTPEYRSSKFDRLSQAGFVPDQFPDYENALDDEETSSSGSRYAMGMKVRHPTFGVGSIFQIEGDGDNQKISVVFADRSFKKFVAKFARLERV